MVHIQAGSISPRSAAVQIADFPPLVPLVPKDFLKRKVCRTISMLTKSNL